MSNELNNKSLAIFVISEKVRAIRTQYDPEHKHFRIAKTFDTSIKPGDLVVVQTGARHKMTVTQVVDVDVEVDFNSSDTCRWIICPVDQTGYEDLLDQETKALAAVERARLRKRRRELAADLLDEAKEDLAKLTIANGVEQPGEPPAGGPEKD